MAFKGRKKEIMNVDKLRTILVNSGFAKENPQMFQTVNQLIENAGAFNNGLNGKLGKNDKINLSEQSEGKVPIRNGGTITGLYTPDLTLVTNLGGAGVDPTIWFRIGDYVHVAGIIQVSPTALGIQTVLGIELPIISYFDFDYQCAGVASCPTIAGESAAILGDVVNNRAQMEWISGFIGPQDFSYTYTYRILQQ